MDADLIRDLERERYAVPTPPPPDQRRAERIADLRRLVALLAEVMRDA